MLCGEGSENLTQFISSSKMLAQKEYQRHHGKIFIGFSEESLVSV